MTSTTIKLALVALLVPTLFVFGCTNNNPLGAVKVTGTVTLDGQPAEGISVIFVPTGEGRTASGVTDKSGRFLLTATGAEFRTGAVPGDYTPTFSKTVLESAGLSDEEIERKFPGNSAKTLHLIPEKYASPSTSGFETVKIEKGKKNQFEFSLQSTK